MKSQIAAAPNKVIPPTFRTAIMIENSPTDRFPETFKIGKYYQPDPKNRDKGAAIVEPPPSVLTMTVSPRTSKPKAEQATLRPGTIVSVPPQVKPLSQVYKGSARHQPEKLPLRHLSTQYDRCTHTFFSAICIAATVIFLL